MIHAKPVPVARVSIAVRRPRRECFLAFTDPEMLTRFWLADAGERDIDEGAVLSWRFRGDADPVTVECREMRPDCLMRLQMSNGMRLMLTFDRHPDGGTMIHYCQCGFPEGTGIAEATRDAEHMLCTLRDLIELQAPDGLSSAA